MPQINPEKGFTQLPAKRRSVDATVAIPADWFDLLGTLIANDILQLDDTRLISPDHDNPVYRAFTQKSAFIHHLNRHAGEASTYALKPRLHESLQTLYSVLADAKTPPDQKHALAVKIHEGAANCTAGFHDRCNECINSLYQPENLDEMLSVIRQGIVSMAANQTTDEVHAYNRFFVVARNMGYGVRPLNMDDIYTGAIIDATITEKLTRVFAARYTLFAVLNSLIEQLQDLVKSRGYAGEKASGYSPEDYFKFDNAFLKPFIGDISLHEFLVFREDENMVPTATDINWHEVKKALLKKVKEEAYFVFSAAESTLLTAMLNHDGSMPLSVSADSLTLISSDNELSPCLTFYSDWPEAIKTPLVAACLERQLFIAARAGHINEVKALVVKGADVNAVLGLLIAKHKVVVMNDPDLRANITSLGLQMIIPDGIHAGKTVADVWMNSKRGRYWFAEDARLQTVFPDTVAGKPATEWLAQAAAEKPVHYARWFSPESRLVKQLVQHVVYGEEQQAKALLEAHPGIRDTLLTGTAKVTDYSNRTYTDLTAFQLALCAWDNEMCDMLKPYMRDEDVAHQYQAIFPEGQEAHANTQQPVALNDILAAITRSNDADLQQTLQLTQPNDTEFWQGMDAFRQSFTDARAQQPFDFSGIIAAITRSNDADLQQALQLTQPNNTALWQALETFRQDFTACSQQERIFNPQHLLKAFEQYEAQFDGWSREQLDLFWLQVMGYVQRFLPANLAQDVAQGLYYRMEQKERSQRSFNFRVGPGSIFPVSFVSLSGLGYKYAVCGVGCWLARAEGRDIALRMREAFGKLMSSKKTDLQNLCVCSSQRPGV